MKMVNILALVLCSTAAAASAQPYIGTALFRWEGSADGGATWTPGELIVPPEHESVLVRARVSWSDPAIRFVHAGFDVAVTGEQGTADTAGSFAFHPRLFSTRIDWVVASRFGSTLKIDYDRDTLPPGEGPGSLLTGSGEEFNDLPPLDHPIEIFRFRLTFDGEPGLRTVHEYFMPTTRFGTGMNTTDRVLVLSDYGGTGRGYLLPQTTRESLNIRVLPAPGGLALLAGVALAAPRRRRRREE